MKIKQLVEQNNALQKQLNEANEKYYENLLTYIRASNFKLERTKEEILIEMMQHILEAQSNGETADQVFGKNPKQLADEIIENLPPESKTGLFTFILEIGMQFLGIYITIIGLMPLFTRETQELFIWKALLTLVLLVAFVGGIIYTLLVAMKKAAFSNEKRKWQTTVLIGGVGTFSMMIMAGVIAIIEPFGPKVEIPFYTELTAGVCCLLISFCLKKYREATE